jgi:hypothetical protein
MAKHKRPKDTVQKAIFIAQIATGEIQEPNPDEGKNAAAVSLGKLGGDARAKSLTHEKRKEIAKNAAKKRWEKE